MFRVDEVDEGKSVNVFLNNKDTYRTAVDLLSYFASGGEEGINFTIFFKKHGPHRLRFIKRHFIPRYIRKVKRRGSVNNNGKYYERMLTYYILTPEGHEFLEELQNKYKEERMKQLYGRIV